jgi:hypothetical protein
MAGMRPIMRREASAPHRVPLGLVLLSRQQLTAEQLSAALAAQREAGCGRIGDWLRELGFASEMQVTAALARQWSCPVLRAEAAFKNNDCCPAIPLPLLESLRMIPVELVAWSRTLLVAFSDGIDYSALYAIEHMLGYRTEPCLASATVLRTCLQDLARNRMTEEVFFERVEDFECARIIGSYAARVNAKEIRLARCGMHLWVRLHSPHRDPLTLVLTSPEEIPRAVSSSGSPGAIG